MNVPIHTRVSPSLHPDFLLPHAEALEVENSPGAGAYVAAREGLAAVYQWHAQVEDADLVFQQMGQKLPHGQRVQHYHLSGERRVHHGNEAEVYEAAGNGMVAALKVAEARLKTVQQYANVLSGQLDKATDYEHRAKPEGITLGSEIRAHFRKLKNDKQKRDDRDPFMREAIKNGDRQTVAAILCWRSPETAGI